MLTLYRKDRGPNHKENIKNNLVIIGPITEEAKAATGIIIDITISTFIQHWYNHCVL